VKDILEVERDEEEHREQRHADQEADDVRAAKRAQAEDRERQQRMALAQLDRDERGEQDGRPGESQQGGGRSPADVDGVDHRIDEQRESRRDAHGTGDVEALGAALGATLQEQSRGERRRNQADRDVDEQHPAPGQAAREDPAEQHAGRAAGARDGAPDAERAVALGAFGERGRDDRKRRRRDDRRAESLDCARDDQPRLRLGQATGQRSEREHDQPDHEHAPAAEQVGETPAEQKEAAEREGVGVHDPREVVAREVQVGADRGERDVDDRRVDHDHELRHRQ
jgi:hypothetical protein